MRTIKKKILAFTTVILMVLCFVFAGVAFDGNDYGGDGGGADWGGGDWGDYDSDWGGSDYGSDGSDWGIFGGFPFIPIVVVSVIVILVLANSNKNKNGQTPQVRSGQGSQGANVFLPNRNDQIQAIIRKKDPNFTADDFITFANTLLYPKLI